MDSFDKRILAMLRDGKPTDFQQLLREAGFSHNTLRLHLTSLKRQGFILETKNHKESPGRPGLMYSLPREIKNRFALTLTDPYTNIVSLTFQKLRHLCRFEKGGYCKNTRRRCEAQNCPQIIKGQ
jgi:predicted ArsR family transcriptional regulator